MHFRCIGLIGRRGRAGAPIGGHEGAGAPTGAPRRPPIKTLYVVLIHRTLPTYVVLFKDLKVIQQLCTAVPYYSCVLSSAIALNNSNSMPYSVLYLSKDKGTSSISGCNFGVDCGSNIYVPNSIDLACKTHLV